MDGILYYHVMRVMIRLGVKTTPERYVIKKVDTAGNY